MDIELEDNKQSNTSRKKMSNFLYDDDAAANDDKADDNDWAMTIPRRFLKKNSRAKISFLGQTVLKLRKCQTLSYQAFFFMHLSSSNTFYRYQIL